MARGSKEADAMDQLWIVAVIVLLVLAGGAVWFFSQRRRTERLASRFGPEYQRAVEETGDRRAAEKVLEEREKRVSQLEIRRLSPEEHDRYVTDWRSVQARFVDDPSGAITEADRLVEQLMEARGYPVGDFEQRSADISVDHPQVVEEYRAADEIATKHAQGNADTEELRQAMVHYRALFEDLLETEPSEPVEARR
jgi:hypothetical protein